MKACWTAVFLAAAPPPSAWEEPAGGTAGHVTPSGTQLPARSRSSLAPLGNRSVSCSTTAACTARPRTPPSSPPCWMSRPSRKARWSRPSGVPLLHLWRLHHRESGLGLTLCSSSSGLDQDADPKGSFLLSEANSFIIPNCAANTNAPLCWDFCCAYAIMCAVLKVAAGSSDLTVSLTESTIVASESSTLIGSDSSCAKHSVQPLSRACCKDCSCPSAPKAEMETSTVYGRDRSRKGRTGERAEL